MTRNIDAALLDILGDYNETPTGIVIEQIKQAFSDARWIPEHKGAFMGDEKWYALVDEKVHKMGYMTGQEWYERFEKEFKHRSWLHVSGNTESIKVDDAFDAARRAAGLDQ